MKKIISIITALAVMGIAAHAEVVTNRQAAEVAARVFGISKVTEAPVWSSAELSTRPAGEAPLFYAFNNPDGGWIIIAGDDCNEPIVGYSDSGEFVTKDMPVYVQDFFSMLAGNIDRKRQNKVITEEVARAWKTAGAQTKAPAGKLLTTASWDQSAPYNNLCPTVDGYKAVTGCVQTAHAIIMRFFEWPEYSVVADLPSYSYTTDLRTKRTQEGHSIGTVKYDWANMPLSTSEFNRASADVKNSIAQVMFDLGVMNQCSYNGTSRGATGTGAYSLASAVTVPKYMKYKRSTHLLERNNCDYVEWCSILKSNIDNDIPLVYSGQGDQGGHCFVMDGYTYNNTGLLFHYNFGWSGQDNGYFSASTASEFPNEQDVTLGFVPDYDGTDSSETQRVLTVEGNGLNILASSGSTAQLINLSENATYRMNSGTIYNMTGMPSSYVQGMTYPFNGTLQFIHYRADGTPVEAVGSKVTKTINTFSGTSITISDGVLHDIAFGDYIALGYVNKTGNIALTEYIVANGGVNDSGVALDRIPMDQVFVLNMKDEYAVGEGIILKDAVSYSKYPRSSISWTVNGKAVSSSAEQYIPASKGTYEIVATVKTSSYGTFKVSKLIEVK